MEEEWRPVKNYEGLYEVSNLGRVRSLDKTVRAQSGVRVIKGRTMRLKVERSGYLRVMLVSKVGQKGKTHYAHRLVALSFLSKKEKKDEVNHIDGNKKNNILSNLEWCTRSENELHAYKTGLSRITERHRAALIKSRARSVRCIDDRREFETIESAGRFYGIRRGGINKVLSGARRLVGGRRFEYIDKKT